MKIIIQETQKKDLIGVIGLYKKANESSILNTVDSLEWALNGNKGKSQLKSYVAIINEKIIGHIGYTLSKYQFNDKEFTGLHYLSWIVDPKYRGILGLQLIKKPMNKADFIFAIGGTEITQKILPALGFSQNIFVYKYFKMLKPIKYLNAVKGNILRKLFFTSAYSISYFKFFNKNKKNNIDYEIKIIEKNIEKKIEQILQHDSLLHNKEEKSFITWMSECPLVKSYIFEIIKKNKKIGTILCYIDENNRGRITHISDLGKDKTVWIEVIKKIELFLKDKNCSIITILSSNNHSSKILDSLGYSYLKKMPVRVKTNNIDLKKIFNNIIDDQKCDEWHLTYIEGDFGYRAL